MLDYINNPCIFCVVRYNLPCIVLRKSILVQFSVKKSLEMWDRRVNVFCLICPITVRIGWALYISISNCAVVEIWDIVETCVDYCWTAIFMILVKLFPLTEVDKGDNFLAFFSYLLRSISKLSPLGGTFLTCSNFWIENTFWTIQRGRKKFCIMSRQNWWGESINVSVL